MHHRIDVLYYSTSKGERESFPTIRREHVMTAYYIELSNSDHDRINLKSSQVDPMCYDNNEGYEVWAIAICDDNGQVAQELDFASRDDRDQFIEDNGFVVGNEEWLYDVESWFITADNGSWTEEIPCKCDVNVAYC